MTELREVLASAVPSPPDFWQQGWDACASDGVHGLLFPTELGGSGGGPTAWATTLEQLGECCADRGLLFLLGAHCLAAGVALWRFGESPELRAALADAVAGKTILANAITERDSGSDALAMSCRAAREDGNYRLTGEKCYVSGAPVADAMLVVAVCDPDAGPLGMSAFLVDAGAPGVSVSTTPKVGMSGCPMGTVRFDGTPVDASRRLGAEGAGAAVFQALMEHERALILAPFVGAMKAQLERTARSVRDRTRRGRSLSKMQAVTQRLARMSARYHDAHVWLHRAARALTTSDRAARRSASCLAKLAISEAAVDNARDAVELAGAPGILTDDPAGAASIELADAMLTTLASGPNDILRELVARDLLAGLDG